MDKGTRNLKVLIVDDEIGMCKGATKVLRKFSFVVSKFNVNVSFDVDYALNGDEALSKLSSDKKDLLLLDYKLPDMSGLDILQKVNEMESRPLVIMITAYASLETAVLATKNGAYDFMAKPFNPDELRNSVKKATTRFILEEEALKLQEEKKRIRFEFISILAHELKAPINAVEGYINMLKKKKEKINEEDLNFILDRSMVRIKGMRKLIFDLLDLTRIESGEKRRHLVNDNLVPVITNALELHESLAKEKGVHLNFNLPNALWGFMGIQEMDIIVGNLISNAIKYNKDGGEVSLKLEKDGDVTRFEVRDTGIGIKEEDQKRLFNDFVRIKNEWTNKITGSGLGLSTVKKIAELYNGNVSVESVYGQGSRFLVNLMLEKKEVS